VYLARPDSTIAGRSVHKTRVDVGRALAREHPIDADLVIGVPESGTPAELIANAVDNEGEMLEAVRHGIGADTLGYVSLRGMIAATEQPASRLCCACFDGNYPIELPSETALGKNVIEHMLANAARTGGLVQAENDNVSALRRP